MTRVLFICHGKAYNDIKEKYLQDEIKKLEEENALKDAYLKKMKEQLRS